MSISETITNSASASSTALNEDSIVHIHGDFVGVIALQVAPTGTTNWLTLITFDKALVTLIATPDSTLLYQFLPVLESGSADVYFGA